MAAASVGDAASLTVKTITAIDTNQTGLTTGSQYWINFDGSLATVDTGYAKAGFALSATNLFITGNSL